MIHRVKPTKRIRIPNSCFDITLSDAEDDGPQSFTAIFDFEELDVDPDAEVVLTEYRRRNAMRFPYGSVAAQSPPLDRRLTTVANPLFRLMIRASDGSGKLLASRDRIKPKTSSGVQSLLWLEETTALGNEVWGITFDHELPTLLVNRNLEGISNEARTSGKFQSLVFPEAMRIILRYALIEQDVEPSDAEGKWTDWLAFVKTFHEDDFPQRSNDDANRAEQINKWIDGAVKNWTATVYDPAGAFSGDASTR